jgi:hypothetical protein
MRLAERYAHAPRCSQHGRDIIMEIDHEKAQYAWVSRWSRIIDYSALFASMVAEECDAIA